MNPNQIIHVSPSPVVPDSIDETIILIQVNHQQSQELARQGYHALCCSFQHAVITGELLLKLKSQLPHGEWGSYQKHLRSYISSRTMRKYMYIAKNLEFLEKMAADAKIDLTISVAEKLLQQKIPTKKRKLEPRIYAAPTANLDAALEDSYQELRRFKTINWQHALPKDRQQVRAKVARNQAMLHDLDRLLKI